jgi:putative DNA primase/helicase
MPGASHAVVFLHRVRAFAYDPAAPEPQQFLAFLAELWPDEPEAIDALSEWFGYILSGRTNLQKMCLMVGPTRGGKGVIARLLTALIGAPNMCGPTLSSFAGEFGLAPLLGKSLAIISDVRFGGKHGTVVVERLLTINRKFREQMSLRLPTRMHLLSIEMPRLTDASGAIVGRFIVVLLNRSWLGREDHALEGRLVAELPGILNWALDGLARLNRNGGRFTPVPSALEATNTLRDLASPVAAFVRECCALNAQLHIGVDDLYGRYKTWCVEAEYPKSSKHLFGRDLHAAFPSIKKTRPRKGRDRAHIYVGIGWREGDDDGREDEGALL